MSKPIPFPRRAELGAYLEAVERYPVLTAAQEASLARRARAGDRAAADHLACCTLRCVVRMAVGLRGYGVALADLVAEGNVGLLEALPRFDPDRGLRLWTYARHWVRPRMLAFVMRQWSVVGIGTSGEAKKLFFALPRERARLRALHGEADRTAALATRFGTSERRVRAMLARVEHRDRSLSHAHDDGGGPAVERFACTRPDAEALVVAEQTQDHLRDRLDGAMAGLDARERYIAQRRWMDRDRPTLTELGAQLGVSRERVRQLEARVRGKLRASLAELAAA